MQKSLLLCMPRSSHCHATGRGGSQVPEGRDDSWQGDVPLSGRWRSNAISLGLLCQAQLSSSAAVGVCQEGTLALPTARSCASHLLAGPGGNRAAASEVGTWHVAVGLWRLALAGQAGQGKACTAACAIWLLSCQATSALPLLFTSSSAGRREAWQHSCPSQGLDPAQLCLRCCGLCHTSLSLKAFLPGAKHCL